MLNRDAQSGVVKKTVVTTSTATRRPALGNLVNRTDKARVLNDKKAASQNGSNESSGTIDLKNVKARVDTYWKNEPLRKPLARSNSVRKASLTSLTSNGSTGSGPKLVKTKTTETAVLKEVKLVQKPALKRQDSTLTRRPKLVSGTSKIATIDVTKRTVTRTKSNDSVEAPKVIVHVPAVLQSRFHPPSLTSSYSNGLIDGVSIFGLFLAFSYESDD